MAKRAKRVVEVGDDIVDRGATCIGRRQSSGLTTTEAGT